jgi:hypothetical protein
MADFEQAGATERLRRVAILRDMQRRLKRSPAEALGVEENVPAAAVRSAFMELTKQYHPAKFARLDEATVKLANEVFLQLREAYETLTARARAGAPQEDPARKPEPPRPGKPVDVTPRRLATNNEATAPARAPSIIATGASIASSIGRQPLNNNSNSVSASGPNGQSAAPSQVRAAGSSSIAASASRAHPLNTSPSSRPRADATPPSTGRAGGSGGTSSASNGGPGRPAASASTSISASPSGPAASASKSGSSGGPRVHFAAATASSGGRATQDLSKEMSRIRELIGRERWAEARDALQLILVRAPSDRANLAQLAYVRGREALELGNVTEARRELVRALAIEPTMESAKAALQEISAPSSRR